MDLNNLKYIYNIDDETIAKRALVDSENGRKTALKELIGEAVIKRFTLWNRLFPNYQSVKKITSKKNQKDGIDFMVIAEDGTVYNIDLKSLVGNYEWDGTERSDGKTFEQDVIRAPIELRQNGIFTNLPSKRTDYLLYIWTDPDTAQSTYSLLDYKMISDISYKCDKVVCENKKMEPLPYIHYTSCNKTGEYILFPAVAFRLH